MTPSLSSEAIYATSSEASLVVLPYINGQVGQLGLGFWGLGDQPGLGFLVLGLGILRSRVLDLKFRV